MSAIAHAPLHVPALFGNLLANLRAMAGVLFSPAADADLKRLYRLAAGNDTVSPELIAALDRLNRR